MDADSAQPMCTHSIDLSTFLMQAGRQSLSSAFELPRLHTSISQNRPIFIQPSFSLSWHTSSHNLCDNCVLFIKIIDLNYVDFSPHFDNFLH
jgi:hypothetical protein